MKRISPVLVALLSALSAAAIAQNHLPPLTLEADYAVFGAENNQTAYVEIFYAVQCAPRLYTAFGADSVSADLMMHVKIARHDSVWAADRWRTSHRLPLAERAAPPRLLNVLRFPIQPGDHVAKLFVRDLNSANAADSIAFNLSPPKFSTTALAMSDIELASSITPAAAAGQDIFCKNALRVVPHPAAIFGAELPTVFYYLEIYRLQENMPGSTYRTRVYIADMNGKPTSALKPREQVKPLLVSSVEVGALEVSTLAGGTYFLRFELIDSNGKALKSVQKKFFVYNPPRDREALTEGDNADLFAHLGEAEIARELGQAAYLFNRAEQEISKKLANPPAQREFLLQFWKRAGQERGVIWREWRGQYLQAVAQVNANFKSYAREGWRTDRGRVYLVYGKPDDVERFPSSGEAKPYEIWTYNGIEGGVEFVFGDRHSLREFQLLHSTKVGEIKNENWRSLLTAR